MNAISRKTQKWLEQRILVFVVREDANGPFTPEINGDVYITNSAPEFRQTILERIQAKAISVPLEDVDELARRAASEAYVVRGFNEAWLSGEITEKDLKKFPFDCNYREYFERSPRVWALALDIAFNAGEPIEDPDLLQN